MGIKYMVRDYILVGWQEDDLPIFGRILYIAVVEHCALFVTKLYVTLCFNHHFHSFVIRQTAEVGAFWSEQLQACAVFQSHQLLDGQLLITFRYHIECC